MSHHKSAANMNLKTDIRSRFLDAIEELQTGKYRLTVTDIMTRVGDHQQSLSLLKNGRRYPTIENIALLCQEFGYNPAWVLLGHSPRKTKKEKDPMERLGEIEREIQTLKQKIKP